MAKIKVVKQWMMKSNFLSHSRKPRMVQCEQSECKSFWSLKWCIVSSIGKEEVNAYKLP
jgi:hypothetical protein